uniref:Uncharacterized protein n=1 Tax=Rhizophora mucronata TaxID=61149 RepID=A0A2P2NNC2_RHIMU
MKNLKLVNTLITSHFRLLVIQLLKLDEEKRYKEKISYSSAFNSLMHTMVCTSPNISQTISMINIYMSFIGKSY